MLLVFPRPAWSKLSVSLPPSDRAVLGDRVLILADRWGELKRGPVGPEGEPESHIWEAGVRLYEVAPLRLRGSGG